MGLTRRRLLGAATFALAGTAGCEGRGGDGRSDGGRGNDGGKADGQGGVVGGDGSPTARGEPTSTATPAALPYRAADPAENAPVPRGVRLYNRGRERYVTVVVAAGERTLFVRSRTVPTGGTVAYPDLVQRAGRYRVIVETSVGGAAGSRVSRRWRVAGALGDLVVVLGGPGGDGGGIRTVQLARCSPACPPLSRGGEAAPLTPRVLDRNGRLRGPVFVENAGDRPREVTVRIAEGDVELLDYAYRIPGGVRLVVPPRWRADRLLVSVDVGTIDHGIDWSPDPDEGLLVTIDRDAVDFDEVRVGDPAVPVPEG